MEMPLMAPTVILIGAVVLLSALSVGSIMSYCQRKCKPRSIEKANVETHYGTHGKRKEKESI
jgi:hypothetical protein